MGFDRGDAQGSHGVYWANSTTVHAKVDLIISGEKLLDREYACRVVTRTGSTASCYASSRDSCVRQSAALRESDGAFDSKHYFEIRRSRDACR